MTSMVHSTPNDSNENDEQQQQQQQEEEEYIALDNDNNDNNASDTESSSTNDNIDVEQDEDVEIDLTTKPPSNKALRKAPKIPKHFRKSNAKVYDNVSVYAPPDSNLIFRCSQKRANWYLVRNLARPLDSTSIHLNFAPAGQGHVNDPYYLEERENKCVICGQETVDAGATMLHVVPEQYRKWFPIKLKSHSSHDIVVACPECNAQWDREAAVVRKKIVSLFNIPLEGVGWVKDHEAGVAKRSAGAVITEWKRQWQDITDRKQRQEQQGNSAVASGSVASELAAPATPVSTTASSSTTATTENTSQDIPNSDSYKLKSSNTGAPNIESSVSSEQEVKGHGKKVKVKKQNVIPRERLLVLEKNVYDWWNSINSNNNDNNSSSNSNNSVAATNISEESSSPQTLQKRELPSAFAKESMDSGHEILKKLKSDVIAESRSQSLSTTTSSETEAVSNNGQEDPTKKRKEVKEKEEKEEIPSPPPGHNTLLTSAILEAALGAQASYKGKDYKEHGQLVVARIMASSPEYYQDADESQELVSAWREAVPLKNPPEGWRNIQEFIRTWRIGPGMRLLDLNRYSLLSFGATLIAIAYSSHKSLFHTPSSFLNLGLLKSLEPVLKDVIPPIGADSPPFSQASFDSVLNDLLHTATSKQQQQQQQQQQLDYLFIVEQQQQQQPSSNNKISSTSTEQEGIDSKYEHSRLLGGAAGIGYGFRPSVLQAMLAERYLKFRTPSPAVLLQLQVILSYLQNEKMCVLVFVNMAFCLAFLTGRLLLRTFFGELRLIERQHMYDRALNFLLFKVVFVGAILEPRWEGLLIWTAWFTVLGFLRVFSMLCRDRFEYLTVSPNIPIRVHVKILSMLLMILTLNIAWFVFCISVFRSMLLLLSFECFTLFLDTIQTLVKYVIHLGDMSRQGPCESRRMVQYYTEFVTDTMILVTTLGHYLHIMYLHGISFTLIDAVLFLNMRSVYNTLRKKLAGHQAYRQALNNMQALYPSATEKELADYSDDCAICRDSMTSAKILPCGHIFHLFCIRSWLEHHSSCPTCRRSLVANTGSNGQNGNNSRNQNTTHDATVPSNNDSHLNSRIGSSASSPTFQSTTIPSTPSSSSFSSTSAGHSTSNVSLPNNIHSASGTNSNRSSTGHQLFAFNSEQQPWLSRLGFPRITVEVVDSTPNDDESSAQMYRSSQPHNSYSSGHSTNNNSSSSSQRRYHSVAAEGSDDEDDEDLRRAIAESLAMSQMSQPTTAATSTSTTSSPSPLSTYLEHEGVSSSVDYDSSP
ncbi:hypothetical protein BGZ49_004326 [Haplosporangium sp. Z 27]|nr:hypothetical protein BGZ49_004326 [Haplosporangium sp. Z 27]